MNTFEELNLNKDCIEALKKQNIDIPTEIQSSVIPVAMENKNIVAESYTGSGKTLAYLLPLFCKVDCSRRENQAIILAPTHELVMQIESQISLLAENSGVLCTSITIIGEVNIERQIKKLKELKPHIIVGTPGRVLDLIKKRKIACHTVKTIIIDEADRLLTGSSTDIIKNIVKATMRDRQIICCSATIKKDTLDIASQFIENYEFINVSTKVSINPNITNYYIVCNQNQKFETLKKALNAANADKSIVFSNSKYDLDNVAMKLNYHNKTTFVLSGNVDKEKRKQAMESFRNGKINILVASDISARGMDINNVTHIFNLDMPKSANEYIHRSGRTARGTNMGTCISIVSPHELADLKKIQKMLHVDFTEVVLHNGKFQVVDNRKKN